MKGSSAGEIRSLFSQSSEGTVGTVQSSAVSVSQDGLLVLVGAGKTSFLLFGNVEAEIIL